MGMEQGGFCVGCSGALMVALFALGAMSIVWLDLIAALIALEKLLPWTVVTIGTTAAALALLGTGSHHRPVPPSVADGPDVHVGLLR